MSIHQSSFNQDTAFFALDGDEDAPENQLRSFNQQSISLDIVQARCCASMVTQPEPRQGLKDDMNCDFQSFVWRRLIYSWEAKNLFGDRTSSEESLLHSIRSGNLLRARNYPARAWVDDPRTPLASNSGSLISSEMSLHHRVEKHGTGKVLHQMKGLTYGTSWVSSSSPSNCLFLWAHLRALSRKSKKSGNLSSGCLRFEDREEGGAMGSQGDRLALLMKI
ncbi:hypothetical protein E5288_WYG019920 [Bos mutus]|uniref:Uncharacterized protein n=1 Tax=Bos mutus TaxID=72004 RepID=A0A6B0RRI1_9CETA|nr:hypothetical protein [Bos mutus]